MCIYNVLSFYANDFSKHAPTDTVPRINMVWNSIPIQLTKENKKFIYGMVRKGASAKDFEVAIQWLTDCRLLHKGYRVSKPDMPLIAYMEMNVFKLYLMDVGLLSAMCGLDARSLLDGKRPLLLTVSFPVNHSHLVLAVQEIIIQ